MAKARKRIAADPPGHHPPGAAPAPSGRTFSPGADLVWVALILSVWAAYWGILSAGFINFDDPLYVTENPAVRSGLNARSALWALTSTDASNWHPLTWLSHMADVELFGLNPGRHHGVNLLLHTMNAVLLLLLLARATGALWRSALVAGLFALHPLHVESVAWVAERKDVLSTFFGLLALLAWVSFAGSGARRWYAASLLLFALSLAAKPMLVTLPFLLLLMDAWPLRRLDAPSPAGHSALRGRLAEKLPFFVLSALSCAVTLAAQWAGGSVVDVAGVSLWGRLGNAVWAYGAYLYKTLLPLRLAVFYPLSKAGHPAWQVALSALLLLALTGLALRLRNRAPHLAFGWFWFLGTLVPVIGLVQVGGQSMADRYTYVPLIGLFVAVAWGLGGLAERRPSWRTAIAVSSALVLLLLSAITRAQVRHWSDSVTLFGRALQVTSGNYLAHNNIGSALVASGRVEEGADHLREALRIRPDYAKAHDNLGLALERLGMHEEAMRHFELALRGSGASPAALVNLGNTLAKAGRFEEAIARYRKALELRPDLPDAYHNLGLALASQGKNAEARTAFAEALRLDPANADAHFLLGCILARAGEVAEALPHLREAVRLRSDFAPWRSELGKALASSGRIDEAQREFEAAAALDPKFAEAQNDLGRILAAKGDLPGATERFRRAVALRPEYAEAHNNLGLALAEQGSLREAEGHFREAVRLRPEFAPARENLRRAEAARAGGAP